MNTVTIFVIIQKSKMKQLFFSLISVFIVAVSCNSSGSKTDHIINDKTVASTHEDNDKDYHSFSNTEDVYTEHIHLDLEIDFEHKNISGVARHKISKHSVNEIIFDSKALEIIKITTGKELEKDADFELGEKDELLGQALKVQISPETEFVNIYYTTTDKCEAIEWLPAELTSGKEEPFLYTQGQAILTRSWIPLQDSPSIRITYSADVKTKRNVLILMSASNPTEKNAEGIYHFEMNQKIPSYLIAIAAGDLIYTPINSMCGFYSEKELTEACTYEFGDLPKMIDAASNLYGPYLWGKYDIIVLPYSFPFGGMENPRLTFANPTLLTGDRSSTSVIAHELAHSWSGNLVTNSTWNDFWLNEGFTVYFENRIMEEIYGKETADILATIEYQDLITSIGEIEKSEFPEDSKLKLELNDRDPDAGMTDIAYVKGALFLRSIEQEVGRKKLDSFLNQYFIDHAFESITTEDFTKDLKEKLLSPNNSNFNYKVWIYESGIPEDHVKIHSKRLDNMISIAQKCNNGEPIFKNEFLDVKRSDRITQEWLTFIRNLDSHLPIKKMKEIDDHFLFSTEANAIIKSDWFKLVANTEYKDAYPAMSEYLQLIGRRWLIEGIYNNLMNSKSTFNYEFAQNTFEKSKNNYHFVTRSSIQKILDK